MGGGFRYGKLCVALLMNLLDMALGFAAILVASILSLLTGGFSFFSPWIFWSSLLLFAIGFSRPSHAADVVWRRVASINLIWFLGVPLLARGVWWVVIVATVATIVPTIAGIWLRRLIARRKLAL